MEGLFHPYTSPTPTPPTRRILRRETRSIAEWREKGKYQPFDLSTAGSHVPERAATWHGPGRRSAWPKTETVECENHDDNESGSGSWEDGYVYDTQPTRSNSDLKEDYFSVPRTTKTAKHTQELFTEEPLGADIPEAELESSRRRSIDLERQPLFLETKEEDDALVEDIIQHLADPSFDHPGLVAAAPEPMIDNRPTTATIIKLQPTQDMSEPPSPEDIIELQLPVSRTVARYVSTERGPRSGEMTPPQQQHDDPAKHRSIDLLKGDVVCPPSPPFTPPPAPLPEMLIPDTPRAKPKVEKEMKKIEPEVTIMEVAEEVVIVEEPVIVEKVIVEPVIVEKVVVVEPDIVKEVVEAEHVATEETPKVEAVVPRIQIDLVEEESPIAGGVPIKHAAQIQKVVSVMPTAPNGGVSLSPMPSASALFPPSARSDEGYLSGESDSESDDDTNFGVSLLPAPAESYYHSMPIEDAAPLPEDIISNHHHTAPRENERYQHHCLLHGHFFPKAGPLRSSGFPHEPFLPWISCDRCQHPRLAEAWQCSLLNQCGIVVCTPCHDELEFGVARNAPAAAANPPAIVLEARVDGVREGLEMGMQRGLKIGFEVGLAGKAKEIVARQEREEAKRRMAEQQQEMGFRGHRSWEAAPKAVRRVLSMRF